jgi:hypothetical protein
MQALPHYKKGKKAGKARKHNARRRKGSRRSRRRNPAASLGATAGRPAKMLMSKGVWMDVALVGAGVFANYQIRNKVAPMILPATANKAWSYAVGVGSALALGFVPKVGPKLMVGGLLLETVRAVNEYVMPAQYKIPMGEYLDSNIPMGDYLNTQDMPRLGDYLNTDTKMGYLTTTDEEGAGLSGEDVESTFE